MHRWLANLEYFYYWRLKIFLAIAISLLSNETFAQILQTPFKEGNWYKIQTDKNSIYKLDYEFMTKKLNISANQLKFSTFGIFGYSGGMMAEDNSSIYPEYLPENSIKIIDNNSNDQWDGDDYVLFYSKSPYAWRLNGSQFVHSPAYYTHFQTFFISTDRGSGKRVVSAPSSGSPQKVLTTFYNYSVYHLDSVNPNNTGRMWFCPPIAGGGKPYLFKMPIQTLRAGESGYIKLGYYNKIKTGSYTLLANGSPIGTRSISANPNLIIDSFPFIANGSEIEFSLQVTSTSTELFYLDFLELHLQSGLNLGAEPMGFRTLENIGTNSTLEFRLNTNGKQAEVWNVTDIENIRSLMNGNGSVIFQNQTLQEFIAFSPQEVSIPIAAGKVSNQDIKSLDAAYHTIVYNSNWKSAAEELAKFHREERGISVNLVEINQCYNEFSFGNKDPMAIRRMMRHFRKKGNPRTLLLFGDASIAQKKQEDYIPTYETLVPEGEGASYCTDDFYGLLDDDETIPKDGANLEIGVGRLPVNSLTEARFLVDKIKAYKSAASYGDWRTFTSLVADDVDNRNDEDFFIQSESISKYLLDSTIKVGIEKIYLDAFRQEVFSGGQRYEQADKLIKDRMIFGGLMMTYIGHGGSTNWAQERVLSLKDIETYKNVNNLPFITTATCGFAPYDLPNNQKSAGEKFVIQRDGGAIAMMTTSREVYIQDQQRYMNAFVKEFFSKDAQTGEYRDFGEIARTTKNANGLNTNSQKIVLLGDPALQINMPKYSVRTTSISGGSGDTLKALSKAEIKGQVEDENGRRLQDFNGFVSISIFDKPRLATTNDNDGTLGKIDSFIIQDNIIFRGRATVRNGQFSVQFIVPKNINYAYGNGKILYYAADITKKPYRDASGVDRNLIIGGANLDVKADGKPPLVLVFLNDSTFGFGGTTDANPKLFATFYDENGINTSNVGIGQDIEAILDEDSRNPITLNRYYQTKLDDYTRGTILYPFYNLKQGKHTLKVRAWDTHNNVGEGFTEFYVYADEELALNRVLNYPNPFTTNTYFEFEHNRPGQPLDVTVNILTITGRVVKSIHTNILTEGYRASKLISWDGLDNYGDKIGRGAYIYQVTIRDSKGKTAQKYEKLVILQ